MGSSDGDRGFVLFHRKFWDNKLLHEPGSEFSKRMAWLYIFSNLANGIDRNGIPRGQFEVSTRYLSKKWNWSQSKVSRFIGMLEKAEMIKRVSCNEISVTHQMTHQMTRFSVCNYETYQYGRLTERLTGRLKSKEGIKESKNKKLYTGEILERIPTKDGIEFEVTSDLVEEFKKAYPSVDISGALKKIRIWAIANPQKQWTLKGCMRGINSWLSRDADKTQAQTLFAGLGKIGEMK